MRKLAQYAMRGNKQATMVAVLFAIIPVLFWISAALVALVILRKGYRDGAQVFMWSLLPAIAWWSNGDPTPALTLIGAAGLASVLRYSASWAYVLVASLVAAIVSMPILASYLQDVMVAFAEAGIQLEAQQKLPENVDKELLQTFMEGVLGAVHMAILLACVVLARWWQAALFNPGGFQEEFHRLRLSNQLAVMVLIAVVAGFYLPTEYRPWVLLAAIPLLLSGVALIHHVVKTLQLGGQWLVLMYFGLIVFSPTTGALLVGLAFSDSMLNLRSRLAAIKNR